jgi:hypothetical protein
MSKYNLTTLNLRDFQEAIERGEYSDFPAKRWMDEYEANLLNESALFICPYDGTIYQTPGKCPSPYHPHPRPRASNRIFQWFVFLPAIIAFTYSLINNEALVNLIVTVILLSITAIVFTAMLSGVIYVWAKISPETVIQGIRLAGHFLALLSAFFAMITVAIIQGKFPPLIWWVIELVVAFVLENYVTDIVARRIIRSILPNLEVAEPDDSLKKLVQKCANDTAPAISHRLLFLGSCLSVGVWLFSPALFNGNLPPIWLIPFILAPYVVWLWKFYERYFNLIQCPPLITLIRDDPDVSLTLDVLTNSVLAIIRPTDDERRKHWWQILLFYFSIILPPGGLIAAIVWLELQV